MQRQEFEAKCEFCPCGCGQMLKPGQKHHSDPVAPHCHEEDHDSCCHCHEHDEDETFEKKELIRIIAGAVIYAAALIFSLNDIVKLILFIAAYLIIGGEVLLRAARNILHGRVFDENLLMTVATIGAFAIGEYPEAVAVMLFYQVGELFQNYAVGKSRRSIAQLMDIRPDYANLLKGETEQKVSPEQVAVGDIIVVKPGERVPLDGAVLEGSSYADTSALTGESVPRSLKPGDAVYSGIINQTGVLKIRVEKEFAQSTASKILELVENASSRKAPTENFISRFARYYTPIVVLLTAVLATVPPLLFHEPFSGWLYRALSFLVISCPCALVISIPLGFFGGIGAASRRGILVKGGNYLEALRSVDTVVFDKTGTLTEGVFKVSEIKTFGPFPADEVLSYAAYIEGSSTHPIAKSIVEAYAVSGKAMAKPDISDYEEISGHGLKATINGRSVLAGNQKLMEKFGISVPENGLNGTVVYIALDGALCGALSISDQIKPDAKQAIASLKSAGVRKIVMLTGDREDAARIVAKDLGVDAYYAGLLPSDKVTRVDELISQNAGKVAFVGDGINDAPVLARADVGIAMGGLGSDAAIEAADVVIMNDEPSKLVPAIRIARRTQRIVWENIIMAMVIKAASLMLIAGGLATMWEAVFADVGVALLAILNALRVMKGGKI